MIENDPDSVIMSKQHYDNDMEVVSLHYVLEGNGYIAKVTLQLIQAFH